MITLDLTGQHGNAWAVMGTATAALRQVGKDDLIEQYGKDAMSGDYEHLLDVTRKLFEEELHLELEYIREFDDDEE